MSVRSLLLLSFLLLTLCPLTAAAAPTVYEGFSDYANDGEVLSVPGGSGFSDKWQPGSGLVGGAGVPNPNSVQLLANSLAYTDAGGATLQTAGGSLFLTGQYGNTKLARTYDQTALPHPAPPQLGETTYLSFLARRSGLPADPNAPVYGGDYPWGDNLYPRVAGVTLYSNDGGDQVPLLVGNLSDVDQDTWRLAGQDLDDGPEPQTIDQPFGEGANTYFVVFRINHAAGDGDGDNIQVYLNPLLESEALNPVSLDVNWEADDDPLYLPGDWISVQVGDASGNRPYSEFTFDEYRIGTSWQDVAPITRVPEPIGLAMLLIGVSLIVAARRDSVRH